MIVIATTALVQQSRSTIRFGKSESSSCCPLKTFISVIVKGEDDYESAGFE